MIAGLKAIEKKFHISLKEMKRIIEDFHSEMDEGLAGNSSSLKMIPSYVGKPTGNEKGRFIALDLGGTNFRILELDLKGGGRFGKSLSQSFTLDRKYLTGRGEELFDFIADCVKDFLNNKNLSGTENLDLGFTFSFPVEQTAVASGRLLRWTKGFSARGVIGEDVVKLLDEALARADVNNVKVAALANDTVGTLVSKAYTDPDCDVGVILGTGTNACYAGDTRLGRMIINIEWGNFNKLKTNIYDKRLDEESKNHGSQILEKMVSGMYLGELFRLIANDMAGKRLFGDKRMFFKTEYMSEMEADHSKNLSKIAALFRRIGIKDPGLNQRRICRKICEMISLRASRISAAALAAVITKIDPHMTHKHTIAIDGSVYEKYPGFSHNMTLALKEILGKKASGITVSLAKDGSGIGSAIIAAVASSV